MKKITKILALTLALITLALSCTSCGNLFISDEEKQEMASNMRNETLFRLCNKRLEDGERIYSIGYTAGGVYLKDHISAFIDNTYIDDKKMSMTIIIENFKIHKKFGKDLCERILEFTFPYEIKSADSKEANEIIISEDRKTLTLVYVHKDINTPEDSESYKIDDEIVIKYKK